MSSYRVMGIAAITGQIAGIAAHVSINTNKNTSDVNVQRVKEIAREQDVIVNSNA